MNIPELIPVQSSNVAAIAYDLHTQTLYVQFIGRKGAAPSLYSYLAVPPHVYERFMQAPTKGGFFAAEIRSKFSSQKMQ
jgi:hypothetical protein